MHDVEREIKENGFIDLFPKDDWYFSLETAVVFYWHVKSVNPIPPPQDQIDLIFKLINENIASGSLPVYSYHLLKKQPVGEYILKRGDMQELFFEEYEGILEPDLFVFFDCGDVKLKPQLKKRQSKAKVTVTNWLKHYGGEPATCEALIAHCAERPPQGYAEISRDKDKVHWKEAGQADSVGIKAFKGAFKVVIKGD